jgi:hypothetical protein
MAAAVFALLLFASMSTAAAAASYELSKTVKKSFDAMTESAGGKLRTQLNGQYGKWLELQERIRGSEAELKSLQQANDESLKAIRERIKRIDEDKIAPLKQSAAETKERYKPLLDSYTAVNKQIEAARPLQNKELNAMLRMQADSLKIPVQLARSDMKAKDAALKAAKDAAAAKQKKARDTLEAIEAHEEAIKAEKTAAAAVKKSLDADWKTFAPLVKQGDANGSSEKLAAMLDRLEQLARHKTNMVEAENKIAAVIEKAKKLLPGA